MALAMQLLFITLHAIGFYFARGDDHRCTCVMELPAAPEPNRAVLQLLEKQLDRCGPEHQTCPACPRCSSSLPEPGLGSFPEATGTTACFLSLMLGIVIGRFSYKL